MAIDIDECSLGRHSCEHRCVNTVGSYRCACNIGYELGDDAKSCRSSCGGVLEAFNKTEMTLKSPSFPENYPKQRDCTWKIIAPSHYKISLNFTHFDLEGTAYDDECEYDSVEISVGNLTLMPGVKKLSTPSDASPPMTKLGRYCGSLRPASMTAPGNVIIVHFVSDGTVERSGFEMSFFADRDECQFNNGGCRHKCTNVVGSYRCSCNDGFVLHSDGHDCKEGECRFELNQPDGELSTPNYPMSYQSRSNCSWLIRTVTGHRIGLRFLDFELERSDNCLYDSVVVYDGVFVAPSWLRSSSVPQPLPGSAFGRYCGHRLPPEIVSTGSSLQVVFKSDASVQRKGFRAFFKSTCGSDLVAPLASSIQQRLRFFSHPGWGTVPYPSGMRCQWNIRLPSSLPSSDYRLVLDFIEFAVERTQACKWVDFSSNPTLKIVSFFLFNQI